jgi:outer membrane lipoprotein-sorting protein
VLSNSDGAGRYKIVSVVGTVAMDSTKRRPAIFAVLTAAMLLTSGTAGVALAATPAVTADAQDAQDDDTPDGDEIVAEFRDTIDSLETVNFTVTTESTFDNETTTRVEAVDADLEDDQKRVETLNSTFGSNTTTVWNGTTVTTYFPEENSVSEYEVTGASLLPSIEALANESIVSYEYTGNETIDGQETYVLEGTPESGTQPDDVEASMTVYVNTETYFPEQIVHESTSDDFEYSSTTTYENVTLNAEIPDSTFELDLPDNVTDRSETTMPDISEYDTYDDVVSATNLSVPAANLTDGFNFDSGVIVDGDDFHSVTLTYTSDNDTVDVVTRGEPVSEFNHSESDYFESVSVGDTTGYLSTHEDFVSLYVEGDQPYTIHGEIDEETAIDVAEAILDD